MTFRILALSFADAETARLDGGAYARSCIADSPTGYPCRVSLVHARPGERVHLFNYRHHDARTPYWASYATYVREGAQQARLAVGEVPEVIACRTVSLRAYDEEGVLGSAELSAGSLAAEAIDRLLGAGNQTVHIHHAAYGCYLARAVPA